MDGAALAAPAAVISPARAAAQNNPLFMAIQRSGLKRLVKRAKFVDVFMHHGEAAIGPCSCVVSHCWIGRQGLCWKSAEGPKRPSPRPSPEREREKHQPAPLARSVETLCETARFMATVW